MLALSLAAACAHDVRVQYPGQANETGAIAIQLSRETEDVHVVVNGRHVVVGAYTQHVSVSNVETGYADVSVAAGAIDKQFRVWVDAGKEVTLVVAAYSPPQSGGWLSTLISLAATFAYVTLL